MRTISVKLFWFWTSGSGGDFIWRYFLSRALEAPFLAEQNHLCNSGRGHHKEQFCEMVLNSDQWFRRCSLKKFLIYSYGGSFVWWSGPIYAVWVESTIRNISVILFWIWTSGSGGAVDQRYFLTRALAALCSAGRNSLCNFGRGYHKNQFYGIFLNLDQLFRRSRFKDF